MAVGAAYGTVADIEILFTTMAGVGLVFSIFNIIDAWHDRQALKEAGVVNGRMPLAEVALRVEIARAAVQTIFTTIGLLAMTLPETDNEVDGPWNVVLTGIVFRWGLITAALLIFFQSIENRRLRQYLRSTRYDLDS